MDAENAGGIRLIKTTAILISLLFSSPTWAQWETVRALPVPIDGQDPISDIQNFWFDSFDKQQLKSGAIAPLNYAFGLVSFDAKKLADAGFPEPKINRYLTDESGTYIPIFWHNLGDKAGGDYSCQLGQIRANSEFYDYRLLQEMWERGGWERSESVYNLSSLIIHELVHAIQEGAGKNSLCLDNPNWISEALAEGISAYLLSKRDRNALRDHKWARNERNYSVSLVERAENYNYESGSFIRYLIEATETNGVSDLALPNDIIRSLTASDVTSRTRVIDALDVIVRRHSGGRPLAMILAEFHAEYGSYSARYDTASPTWMRRSFGRCVEYNLTPGQSLTQTIRITSNAARCIIVRWALFEQPAALQLYLAGEGADEGNLHVGEAVRASSTLAATKYCWSVTKAVSNRIARDAETKCILRRGAVQQHADGSMTSVNGWTSDFNVDGDGAVFLTITNANEKLSTTEEVEINLTIGTNLVKDESEASLPPRKKAPNPVKDGRTLMDSRVHALAGGPGRLLIDGRSVSGGGLDDGFLEGSPGAGEIDGAAVVVRTGEYNVILIKDKTGFPNGAAIMREPDGSFSGAITTLGMKGMPEFPSCGFKIPAELTIREQTKEKLSFRVSGDVFNMSRETLSGQGNLCDRLRTAHVEYKEIDVSLPWSANYDGTATIERAYPPMQDIYDEREFRSGPSFGGIETSRSIVFGDDTSDDFDNDEPEQTPSSTSPTGSTTSNMPSLSCTCLCPGFVHPITEPCFGKCEPVLRQCTARDTLANTAATNAAETNLYRDLLGSRDIPDEIRDILTSDFETMSLDTRRQILRESVWEQSQ